MVMFKLAHLKEKCWRLPKVKFGCSAWRFRVEESGCVIINILSIRMLCELIITVKYVKSHKAL